MLVFSRCRSNMQTFKPKGQPLALEQLLSLSTIRQPDVDEMVKLTLPIELLFINAVPVRPIKP